MEHRNQRSAHRTDRHPYRIRNHVKEYLPAHIESGGILEISSSVIPRWLLFTVSFFTHFTLNEPRSSSEFSRFTSMDLRLPLLNRHAISNAMA